MLTAKEALERSNSVDTERFNQQLKTIEAAIVNATGKGETSVYVYSFLLPQVKDYIETFGYKTKTMSGRNETTVIISWSE